jgi:hypothetical protein
MIIALVGRRHVLSPTDTHFLLTQLALLPVRRWRGVGDVRERIGTGLARGWPVTIADSEAPMLLRAVEGLRVRRSLSAGLRALHGSLVEAAVG